ncbi:hypothetical protein BN1326_110001 [Staphylococcus argenteus]|uniref:Uncharacterized protein n=1 Tax=Staphylococcus argenteus TaxID=985002 RepID=A0A7U7JQN6_9STAP|nr:hypothetical protein BN1326_110001 [Staphylococcus argenteus]CRI11868.1 hypothetical protein BN1326_110001 [Staphylococcus argenteus]
MASNDSYIVSQSTVEIFKNQTAHYFIAILSAYVSLEFNQ